MELRNYRRFRSASVDLPDGVVGILGPNGSGKSTLMEAVAWALYGNESDIVRQGKSGVRSAQAGMNEECSVALDFEISGDQYRVHRSMRGKALAVEAQLTVNGKQLAKGDKGVSDEVRRVLGMDYKSFFISVFARQKELNALSALRPAERGKVVRRMLGIESLTRTVEEIDRDRKRLQDRLFDLQKDLLDAEGRSRPDLLRQELEALRLERGRAEERLRDLSGRDQRMSATLREATARRDSLSRTEEEHRRLQTLLLGHRKDLEAAQAALRKAQASMEELERKGREASALQAEHDEYERALARKEEMEARAQEHVRRGAMLNQRASLEAKVGRARAEAEARAQAAAACTDSRKRLETVEESMEAVKAEQAQLREGSRVKGAEADRLAKEMEKASARLEEIGRLGPEGVCPTCERRLCEQHSLLVGKLRKELAAMSEERSRLSAEVEEAGRQLEQRATRLEALVKRRRDLQARCEEDQRAEGQLSSAKAQLASLEEELAQLEAEASSLAPLDYSEEGHEALRRRLTELRPRWERRRALQAELMTLGQWQEERAAQEAKATSSGRSAAEAERGLSSLGYREGERQAAQGALDALMEQKRDFDRELSATERELDRMAAESSLKEERLAELEARERAVAGLTSQVEEQSALGQAMRDFRESMMARVVPTLSEVSSRLLAELTDGRYAGMRVNGDYEIGILDRGEEYPLARFSGGEADLANLCLRLAISKVIAERAGSALNLLILDEIFGSQDQERKRNIMEAFAQLSRQFSQILLITHIDDVKDMVGAVIVVEENEDGSSSAQLVR
ncbi:MAG: SMC family ATPase [Methanomassiliicoccales archaeon]|nr:SMC family ATPase [Methanomassiliicoccales archaeon]